MRARAKKDSGETMIVGRRRGNTHSRPQTTSFINQKKMAQSTVIPKMFYYQKNNRVHLMWDLSHCSVP